MAARFASNLLILLAGALLACVSLAMPPGVVGWVGLGIGVLVLLVTLGGFAVSGRGVVQRCLDAALALLATWTIVASRAFDGSSVQWLVFSAGAALALLAAQGLVAHEVVLEMSLRRAVAHEPLQAEVDRPVPFRIAS